MSEMLTIALPYPPSVNHYWKHAKNGRHYISKEGREYKNKVAKVCEAFAAFKFKGAVKIKIFVYYPDKRKRDPDNLEKALFDSLRGGGLIEEDHNLIIVDKRTITAGFKKGGLVILKISPAEFKELSVDEITET